MPGRVEDKITCITGATSGIGRSAAIVLAREGAVIVATDVQTEKGAALVSEIEHAGGRAVFLEHDVVGGGGEVPLRQSAGLTWPM